MIRPQSTNQKPASNVFTVAVIGTGTIAQEHLTFLRDESSVDLAGVCDLSAAMANHVAATFGARSTYTDYRRMLKEVQPDVVHVLTPAHTHVAIAGDCLDAGAHVIVEKPIAITRSQFEQLWTKAKRRQRILIEDHNYRFNAPILAIERLIETGELGAVRDVDVRISLDLHDPGNRYADANIPHSSHRLPAGVIHEFITHMAYIALRFVPQYERVSAMWHNHGADELFKFDDLDGILAGPVGHAHLRFTCLTAPDTFTVTVRGTKGWAQTDLFQPYLRVVKPRRGPQRLGPLFNHMINGLEFLRSAVTGFKDKLLGRSTYEGLRRFLDLTYQALGAGTEPPVGYEDMARVLQLTEALLEPDTGSSGSVMARNRNEHETVGNRSFGLPRPVRSE